MTFLTVKQVAKQYPWSTSTIYRWVDERTIPHIRRGRRILFSPEQLEDWLMQGYVETKEDQEYREEYRHEDINFDDLPE